MSSKSRYTLIIDSLRFVLLGHGVRLGCQYGSAGPCAGPGHCCNIKEPQGTSYMQRRRLRSLPAAAPSPARRPAWWRPPHHTVHNRPPPRSCFFLKRKEACLNLNN